MADISDVEATLVMLTTDALYPLGPTSQSRLGVDCRIYRGWPTPAGLDVDLKAGLVNITVFPDPTPGHTMTPYPSAWQGAPAVPTLVGTVVGNVITFSGSADPSQVAGIRILGNTFVYRTVSGDTLESVAGNLATIIRRNYVVHLAGSVLVIPGAFDIVVRTVADGLALREIRRQTHDLRISFWCPTPALRDSASTIVDTSLAGQTFIALPDTSAGRMTYKNTSTFDQSQSAILYRRDLIYSIEYPTILSASLPAMVFGDIALGAAHVSA